MHTDSTNCMKLSSHHQLKYLLKRTDTKASKIQRGTLPYCTGGSHALTHKCHCLIRKSMILQDVVKIQFKINILTFVWKEAM